MTTSRDVLSLIDLLDEVGTDVAYLQGYVGDMAASDPGYFRTVTPSEMEDVKALRRLIARVVQAKRAPSREVSDEVVQVVTDTLGDEYVDECFTRLELPLIPGMVARWKKLRALRFVGFPEDRVSDYLGQATTCYLHGLPTASVILCRAVLEFVLQQAMSALGGVSLRAKRKGESDLTYRINVAAEMGLFPPGIVSKAKRIRDKGGKAVHHGMCSEGEALSTLTATREVLGQVYKTPKGS